MLLLLDNSITQDIDISNNAFITNRDDILTRAFCTQFIAILQNQISKKLGIVSVLIRI
jgi:hypothetical protein